MSISVQAADFDLTAEVKALTGRRTDIGAIVTFTGTVRGEIKGPNSTKTPIISMTLEHYPGMTEAELAKVEAEALARWPLQGTCIIHRFGELHPGDNIVLVIAVSAHRQAAFEAAEFLMDYLKSRAPFWKKETATSGAGSWVDAREADDRALERWGKE